MNIINGLAALTIGYLPFIVAISIFSLKYHTAKYNVSQLEWHRFLDHLILPLRFFYKQYAGDVHLEIAEHTAQDVADNYMVKRVLASIVPILLLIALVIGSIGIAQRGDAELLISYLIGFGIMLPLLIVSWRFGNTLKLPAQTEIEEQL